MRLAASAVLAGLALAGVWTPRALAHGELSPTIQTVIDELDPQVEGVRFRIVPGRATRLEASNRSGEDLTILGRGGRPFLRIGSEGVYADVNSLDWYRSGNPDGVFNPPPEARIGGPARFELVLERSSYAWFDHRLHPGTITVPPEALEARRPARLDDWVVPARLGTRELELRGHVEYRPLLGGLRTDMTSPAQPLPGVQVQLLQGPLPGFFVVNAGSVPVTVAGRAGEPFLRIGPDGVEVNLRSPTHLDDQLAKGEQVDAARTRPRGAPLWRRLGPENSYAWLDTRAFYARQRPPPEVEEGGERVVLKRFAIPLQSGGRSARITGATAWVPDESAGGEAGSGLGAKGVSAAVTGSLVFGLALFGAILVRRRRRVEAR